MRVSIIIPALDEASYVAGAIDSARRAGAFEILVVDGGSRDGTADVIGGSSCRPLESLPGRAIQQNVGAEAAGGDVLLFLHADSRLAQDAIGQIVAALADPRVLGGAFRQRIEAPGRLYRLIEWGNSLRARRFGLPFGDQGLFFRRTVFERLGGFPDVPLMEDLLLMRRFRRLGRPILLPGPIYVSPRRWQRHGVVRQTLRNWGLQIAQRVGVSPERLARFYPRHDAD